MKKLNLILILSTIAAFLCAQTSPTNVALNKPVSGNGINLSLANNASTTDFTYINNDNSTTLSVVIDLQSTFYIEKMDGNDMELIAEGPIILLYVSSDGGATYKAASQKSTSGNLRGYEVNGYVNKIKVEIQPYLGNFPQFKVYDVKAYGVSQPLNAYYSRLGIGTTTLTDALNVNGSANFSGNISVTGEITSSYRITGSSAYFSSLYSKTNNNYFLSPSSSSTSLKVAGNIVSEKKIECEEMEVKDIACNEIKTDKLKSNSLNLKISNVADYVFDADYSLRSLADLEKYVKVNKHLPEVPKATQLETEGMNVAEMNNLLLKKIEELTLYVIELKKENETIKNEIKNITNNQK